MWDVGLVNREGGCVGVHDLCVCFARSRSLKFKFRVFRLFSLLDLFRISRGDNNLKRIYLVPITASAGRSRHSCWGRRCVRSATGGNGRPARGVVILVLPHACSFPETIARLLILDKQLFLRKNR